MELNTENFTLRLTTEGVTMNFPENYNTEDKIIVDLGDKVRNQDCTVTFNFISDRVNVTSIDGDCGCMSASQVSRLKDGTQQILINYKSSRIGRLDPLGEIVKNAQAYLSSGDKLKFKIKMNGIK